MSNKFGWHSGTLTCQNIECLGDVKVQDDIIFSDVSAGRLGVTGGIDMTGTTSAIGINLTGITATTAAIAIGTATGTPQTMAEAEDFAIAVFTTCADTDGANTAKPVYIESTYTGALQVGRCLECNLQTNVQMGGWMNAIKGFTEFTGTSGSTRGLASAVCCEILMPAASPAGGSYYPIEIEMLVHTATDVAAVCSESTMGFIYANVTASTGNTDLFQDHAWFMWINGLVAGATHMLSANSQTLKCNIGLNTETIRYMILSRAEDCLSLDSCATAITLGDNVTTTGISIGDTTTGILLDGDFTTAINIEGTGNTYGHAIMVGAFGESDNLAVTSTNNYPVGVFAKITADINPTSDIRCAWFRLRVNTTVQVGNSANWGSALRGIQGSLKFYGGSGSGTYCWCNAGVFGSIETNGATKVAFRNGSVTGALFAHVGLLATSADDVDIETGAVVAGVAINTGTNTASNITVAGHFCGMYIYNDAGNQSFKYGIFIDDPAIQHAVMIGESGTGSMTITQTNRYPLGVFGRIEGAIGSGLETMRCIRARMQIDANISSGASVYPIQAYNVISSNTVTWGAGAGSNLFGVMAGMETSGSSLILNGWAGGVVAYLSAATGWADASSSCITTGFLALSNMHDTCTINGIYAAFTAYKYAGKEPWTYGIYMANDAATHVMGFSDGTGLADANGMSGSKTMDSLDDWDGWIRIDIGGTDHYIPTCLDPTSA